MALLQSKLFQNSNSIVREDKLVTPAAKANPKAAAKWAGLDVVTRLEECATSDPSHIQQGEVGPHVTAIHLALETIANAPFLAEPPSGVPTGPEGAEARLFNAAVTALRAARVSGTERGAAEYGPSTARAVRAYKTARNIRRRPTDAIDPIVGIMTIKTLDRDLLLATGAKPKAADPLPTTDVVTDFVIHFLGGRSTFLASPDDVKVGLNLTQYKSVSGDQLEMEKDSGRRLHLVARGSDGRNFQNGLLLTSVVNEIRATLSRPKRTLGIICMHGSSAGGRNALFMAEVLKNEGLALEFLGIEDAAFFASEADNTPFPGTLIGKATNKPLFTPPPNNARNKENFFQNAQNFFRPSASKGVDWVGANDNFEIHGKLVGFLDTEIKIPFDSTPLIAAAHTNIPHNIASDEGRKRSGARISALLAPL